ncbi:glycosyltransferase family 2 protein [Sinorhizobium numidicum]|uniref:Glycosyltransferase family 2 protein n=1 Tax=Sinorhizobium numidicum TaxID=680248 RepID=A0ABY8CQJ8_9HYPH|nr:glycosyltransferase family A protein [Sinorhizobium numidicum]WEX74946.1 glycosyltransferase family 2 protein [Sinorhizobium numidicum]WEX80939.1 glycosyltransferase family 2 protein [Sinorhizobium numidicum]
MGEDHNLDNIRVAVVIPAYNAELYISETLKSVAEQTHQNLEIMIVDDGSTDSTPTICRAFTASDGRVKVISTSNHGVAAARNRGIKETSAEYIAFLDADDIWHPTYIDRQLSALHELPPEWGAVYALYRLIDAHGRCFGSGPAVHARGYIFARHLAFKFVGNGSGLMVRRRVIEKIGGYDPSYAAQNLEGCEDFDLEIRIARHFNVEVVPLGLVGYRIHAGSMSSNRERMAKAAIEVTRRCIARTGPLPDIVVRNALLSAHVYAIFNFLEARKLVPLLKSLAAILGCDALLGSAILFILIRRPIGKAKRALKRLWKYTTRDAEPPAKRFLDIPLDAPLYDAPSVFRTPRRMVLLEKADHEFPQTLH